MAGERIHRAVSAAMLVLAAAACGSDAGKAASPGAAPSEAAAIGTATMQEDGTVVLDLRTDPRDGTLGEARLVYAPSHPQYAAILLHLGGLIPGERKPVRPWP